MSFASAFREVINRSGLKPSEWAERLGVSRSAVSQWLREEGGTRPRPDRITKIRELARDQNVSQSVMDRFEASVYESDSDRAQGHTDRRPSFGETAYRARLDHLFQRILQLPADRRLGVLASLEEDIRRVEGAEEEVGLAPMLHGLNASFGEVQRRSGPVVAQFLLDEVAELAGHAELLSHTGTFEKWGRRRTDYILSLFTRLMNLPPAYYYHTCSNLDFWSKYTLGSREGFLAAQAAAHRERDTEIRRVFLVPSDAPLTNEEMSRLHEHLESGPGIQARVRPTSPSEVEGIGNFVLCGPLDSHDEALFRIDYRELDQSEIREFERVTLLTDEKAIRQGRAMFDRQWELAMELEEYLESLSTT